MTKAQQLAYMNNCVIVLLPWQNRFKMLKLKCFSLEICFVSLAIHKPSRRMLMWQRKFSFWFNEWRTSHFCVRTSDGRQQKEKKKRTIRLAPSISSFNKRWNENRLMKCTESTKENVINDGSKLKTKTKVHMFAAIIKSEYHWRTHISRRIEGKKGRKSEAVETKAGQSNARQEHNGALFL